METLLALEMVRVTEAAAIASARLMGRGDKDGADRAATEAMRKAMDEVEMQGTIVIGEGERDEAPMLWIGEPVGARGEDHVEIDIAVDPLEGTNLVAHGQANAITVLAASERGGLLHAPDTYMDKIAIGGGYPEGIVDLDADPRDNILALARAKGVRPQEIKACILDRPRHADIIAKVREAGAAVALISDGDIAGVIHTSDPETGIDIYMGQGGAPEGVLAAAALRCVGGQIQGRLVFRNDDERGRAARIGIKDFNRKYGTLDLASGDVMFAATGVTDGSMLRGIHRTGRFMTSETIVMRSKTGTVRWIRARHVIKDR